MRSPTTGPRPARTRLAGVALLLPLAVGLGACGADDPSTVEAGSPGAVASATEATPSPSTPSGSTGASSAAPTPSGLQDAADAALSEVDGRLFAISQDDDGTWDVTVVSGDGTQADVEVTPSGASVTQGAGDGSVGAELRDASVDYGAAITIAEGAVPDAEVTAMELIDSDGIPSWTVELDNGTSVEIDATSAAVKKVTEE